MNKNIVYISTMNLDGETNLKEKIIPYEQLNLDQISGTIDCDKPNEYLDSWDGNVTIGDGASMNCNIKNVLLRGCTLKNTDYVYGIVLYVGNDTKIMQNSKKPKRKLSNLMLMMNRILYSVFAFQLLLVVVFASLSLAWTSANAGEHIYLNLANKVGGTTFVLQFFTFWVAYSHMIPISLYVIIELLKLGQAKLIACDVKLYYEGEYALCRNSDLIEEMGQIEFIFSDKTGTLTQNKMEFKRISVDGVVYGKTGDCIGMDDRSVKEIQKLIRESQGNVGQRG